MYTKRDILDMFSISMAEVVREAAAIRDEYCGQKVYLRGLIEFSNYCVRNCAYCGLRKHNILLSRYRMTADQIFNAACKISNMRLKTIVLQSGDDNWYEWKTICRLIRGIKDKYPNVAVTLSMGERPMTEYKAFRDAGADRYLLKQESANERIYKLMHPGQSLRKRLRILEYLTKIGYQVGVGCIVGLPLQTIAHLAEDLLFFQHFMPYMVAVGPFCPSTNTPLEGVAAGGMELTYRMIALSRIVTRNAFIPATTAIASMLPVCGLTNAFRAGSNVAMINYTPARFRQNFQIYNKKRSLTLENVARAAQRAGLTLS